ncbi:hypothetical protein CYFUS_001658 [Cystobacter fuscus]|uniref:histidine kinase n=1 Tax=Cystobacter fuscus TaxID=43 RepID=A0A250IWZ2_9BACT|nr:ATP-binding protein [Cystobacter fuscus]ATB36244.1 hypothetical protein CYFUS_001658 [Cystobacter fuscus]
MMNLHEQNLAGCSPLDVVEALEEGFITADPSCRIQVVNQAAERLLRLPRSRLLGSTLASVFGEQVQSQAFLEHCRHALAEHAPARFVMHHASLESWLEVRFHPQHGQLWLFLRDVTRQHQTEERPQRAEQDPDHLHLILKHAPVILFAFDAQGVFTLSEGSGLQRLGLEPGGVVGRSIFDVYRDFEWITGSIRRVLEGEPLKVVGAVGAVWFDVQFTPLRDAAGKVVGGIGIANDVTERERILEALRQQQSVLQYVIANVPHAIFWKDREGRFLGGNQNFIDDTGVGSPENLIGKTDHDVWSKHEEADAFVSSDREVMRSGMPLLKVEEPALRGDGQQRILLTSKVPLRDEAGHVTGLLGIYADITERKRMELDLQKAKEEAEAAARARSEFLTVMSHELRTPLTLILGPLDTLLSSRVSELSGHARLDLERVQRNAERLFRLVDDILDHQKVEARQMKVDWEPVEISELAARIVEDARSAGNSRRLDLRLEADATLGTVPLDRRKFEKIVLNLLGNALKFSPPGSQITVALRAMDGQVELSVADSGPGIPQEQQGLLFRHFQQIDGTTTRKHEGTGMGLAIVKEFAELMGGQVTVESEPGKGARFIVRLPRNPEHIVASRPGGEGTTAVESTGYFNPFHDAPPEPGPAPRRSDKPVSRLLIAEDNPDMRAYLAGLLATEYEVELVETGLRAWEAVQRKRPDVIVSDVMMPEMDGVELATRLKASAQYRDIPIILLTAKASREEVVGGLNAGADDYLGKPFSPAELKARVRAAERLHEAYLELDASKLELQATLRQLHEAQDQIVQKAKLAAVGTLVAGLSHELNNPVAAIRMNAQLLLRHALDPASLRRSLLVIDRQSQRCSSLLRALLEFSRQTPVVREPHPVDEVTSRVLELARHEAHRRAVHLEQSCSDTGRLWVDVNALELETAMHHIVRNALEASPEGATVRLETRPLTWEGKPGVEVAVSDSGPGIPPEDLPRIFEPFFTTKPVGQSIGLGLSLTQRFIDSHGGTLQVDSTVGRGTTVRLWLPAAVPGREVPARVSAEVSR